MNEEPLATTDAVRPHRRGERASRLIAFLLDDAIKVPGTRWRFGFDVLLGLIPGYGDATSTAIGGTILVQAVRAGVPRRVLLQMGFNQLLNGVIGTIPGVGDAFSAFYKSNARNYRLLEQWEGSRDRSWFDRMVVWGIVVLVVIATVLSVFSVWVLIKLLVTPLWNGLGWGG